MREGPAADIEEVLWRSERAAARPTHVAVEVEWMRATGQKQQGARPSPYREAVARTLIALATRIAPTVAVPNAGARALTK